MEVDIEVTVTVNPTCPDCGSYFEWEEDVWVTIEVEHDDFP